MDTKELLNLAARCERLAAGQTNPDLTRKLKELAQDYIEQAKEVSPPVLTQQYQQSNEEESS
jgi:hypothetical protein